MSDGMYLELEGVREFRDTLDDMIVKADAAAKKTVTDGAALIERRAKQKAPVLTGTLRRSIHVDTILRLGPGRWQSRTGPSVIYGRFREHGGTIRPRNAPALAWKNSGANIATYGASTVLPVGMSVTQKATPYMKPAFDESVAAIRDIYRAALREAFEV